MNRPSILFTAAALALILSPVFASAQGSDTKAAETKSPESQETANHRYEWPPESTFVAKTYFLTYTFLPQDGNEILIALRNTLPAGTKAYFIASKNAIEVSAPPDQQTVAQKIISELDRPQKPYRLTFTLTESDAGKRLGVQHFAIIVVNGQHTVLKEGSRVPVSTGPIGGNSPQFQYFDVGMNFDLTLDAFPGGLRLRSKVEQSGFSDEHASGVLSQEPIIRQASLEGTSLLSLGKPLTLGSLDVPGSTRHIDIEVVAEPIP
jgi:type II secretory pathway component GspD/PulD (secretin)